jgi:hypothetical protein
VFCFEWIFHGMILRESYVQTASLWRPDEEMKARLGWLIAGQFLGSVMFCVIYALRGGPQRGIGQGIGYGLLIALLLASTSLVTYAVQPLPLSIVGSWFAGGLVEMLIAGAILGAIYRPASPPQVVERKARRPDLERSDRRSRPLPKSGAPNPSGVWAVCFVGAS